MQLASSGVRVAARSNNSSINFISNRSRNIHIPAYVRPQVSHIASPGAAQRIVSRARTYLGQFISHLTAPGLQTAKGPPHAHAVHGGAPGRIPSIQQRMSFPVRTALSKPFSGYYFPKAPSVRPCSVTNLGLGTARNYSSSSHGVFRNLAQNVPVAGRAFVEADWELREAKSSGKKKAAKKHTKAFGKERLQPKQRKVFAPVSENEPSSVEMDRYFSTSAAASQVTTYLLIPLAPTPTSRAPLPEYSPEHHSLLPHSDLWNMHNNHELHSLKVSSLFSRLDVANVWERGVQCSAYAHSAGVDGVCTILRVEFPGWTKAEVRGIIGESGTSWCVLEEALATSDSGDEAHSDSSSLSGLSGISTPISECSAPLSSSPLPPEDDFILPTLDFSSTFLGASRSSTELSLSPQDISEISSDMFSDSSSDSWSELSEPTESLASSKLFGFRLSQ